MADTTYFGNKTLTAIAAIIVTGGVTAAFFAFSPGNFNPNALLFAGQTGVVTSTPSLSYTTTTNTLEVENANCNGVCTGFSSGTTTLQTAYDGGGTALGRSIDTSATSTPVDITYLSPSVDLDLSLGLTLGSSSSPNQGIILGEALVGTDSLLFLGFSTNTSSVLSSPGFLTNYNPLNSSFQMSLDGQGGVLGGNRIVDLQVSDPSTGSAALKISGKGNNVVTLEDDDAGERSTFFVGNGSPEGSITSNIASMYFRTDGVVTSSFAYVKTSDGGSSGWTGLLHATSSQQLYAQGGMSVNTLLNVSKTITSGATLGTQTINTISGSVNFAALATSVVVTSTLSTVDSIILTTVGRNDATMDSVSVLASNGFFTLFADTAPTANTRVNFLILN